MPSEAAGPVAETVTPTVMSAQADAAAPANQKLAPRAFRHAPIFIAGLNFGLIFMASHEWGLWSVVIRVEAIHGFGSHCQPLLCNAARTMGC